MTGSIAAVPIPDPLVPSDDIFDPLMIRLRQKWNIEVPIRVWPEPRNRMLRISAQKYNSIDEYELFALTLSVDLGG